MVNIKKFVKKEKEYEKIKAIDEVPLELKRCKKNSKCKQKKKDFSSI